MPIVKLSPQIFNPKHLRIQVYNQHNSFVEKMTILQLTILLLDVDSGVQTD